MRGKVLDPSTSRMYNQSTLVYSQGGSIDVIRGCFAFMVTNLGDTTARVNGMLLYPSATPTTDLGDSRTISGHDGDLFLGDIRLSFTGSGSNPLVEIVQLFYILKD
jgi:hypothetical protein